MTNPLMTKGPFRLANAVVLAGTMAMAACSSGGGAAGGTGGSPSSGGTGGAGGAGSSVTTLGGTKAVNALTAAEATQLCNDTYAYFGSAIAKATTCKFRGLAYGASSSAPS